VLADAAARPYADALLELAAERKKVDAWMKQLDAFAEIVDTSDDLRIVLTNPGIPIEKRKSVLDAVVGKVKTRLDTHVKNFLRLLIDRGRMGIFDDVVHAYRAASDEAAGRVRGVAVATTKLNKMQLSKLEKAVTKIVDQDVVLEAQVDESLIGGLRIEVAGRVFDGSIRGQLETIREQLRA